MLKLGDKTISKICLGDKVFNKAYLGDKVVFQSIKLVDYALTGSKFRNTAKEQTET